MNQGEVSRLVYEAVWAVARVAKQSVDPFNVADDAANYISNALGMGLSCEDIAEYLASWSVRQISGE